MLVPSPALNGSVLGKLRTNGVDRAIFGIDGQGPESHDAIRSPGHFTATLQAIRWARMATLPVEINTLVSSAAAAELESIATLVADLGAVRWNLFFMVPLRQSRSIDAPDAGEIEGIFERVYQISAKARFAVRTFEAPHYARFLAQHAVNADFVSAASDVVFISHTGEVGVSPFVPTAAGNVRYHPLSWVFRNSDLMVALRDDRNIKGKCGRCEYHSICLGSRARAWATSGDLFGSDPLCAWQPAASHREALTSA